jgi:hypothetical protein
MIRAVSCSPIARLVVPPHVENANIAQPTAFSVAADFGFISPSLPYWVIYQ